MNMWLLPQNPGPFGSLSQWKHWQGELRALGAKTPGVDAELEIAKNVIRNLEAELRTGQFVSNEMATA
jgi:hypothetical protein